MHINPLLTEIAGHSSDSPAPSYTDFIEVSDSVIAVLTQEEIDIWRPLFRQIAQDIATNDQSGSFEGAAFAVFPVAGQLLAVASDHGDESATEPFMGFCQSRGIACQFVIDSIDCSDIDPEDIYTGEAEDNLDLLRLLHKVYNP